MDILLSLCKSFLFFNCHTCGIWKFPSQGLNSHHSSNPSHCSDNTWYLTCCATGERQELKKIFFFFFNCYFPKKIIFFLFNWARPGIKSIPQQQPKPLQWQRQILNLLHHKRAPSLYYYWPHFPEEGTQVQEVLKNLAKITEVQDGRAWI